MQIHTVNYSLRDRIKDMEGYNSGLVKNFLKEYLQDFVLDIIYNDSKYKNLIFYGGTSLRKLYGIDRLSEDLDFESTQKIDLKDLKKVFEKRMEEEKIDFVDISVQSGQNVSRCILKFAIMHDLGLSENRNEKLCIKVEVNSQKKRYDTEITPYTKVLYAMLIKHYSLPVCMASKMVACVKRTYVKGRTGVNVKGRDYYDLVWYMQNLVKPDKKFLKDNGLTVESAFEKIGERVEGISSKDLLIDLETLHPNIKYVKGWCKNFHVIYTNISKKYRGLL